MKPDYTAALWQALPVVGEWLLQPQQRRTRDGAPVLQEPLPFARAAAVTAELEAFRRAEREGS